MGDEWTAGKMCVMTVMLQSPFQLTWFEARKARHGRAVIYGQ